MTQERKATKEEQISIIQEAVETTISQAAELSGLRNWLIYRHFKQLKAGEWPNGEMINFSEGEGLIQALNQIIDPDDSEYLTSRWFTECCTEKGIFKLHEIVYEDEPL